MIKNDGSKIKNEVYLICGLLVFALIFYAGYRYRNRGSASVAVVSVNGEAILELPLDQDNEVVIRGAGNGTNHLIIKDGAALVTEASCPDLICVREGAKREKGEAITCLPNKVIIAIK